MIDGNNPVIFQRINVFTKRTEKVGEILKIIKNKRSVEIYIWYLPKIKMKKKTPVYTQADAILLLKNKRFCSFTIYPYIARLYLIYFKYSLVKFWWNGCRLLIIVLPTAKPHYIALHYILIFHRIITVVGAL